MSACPSISCSARRSHPPASRWVANVWRRVCGLIFLSRPALLAWRWTILYSPWRVSAPPRRLTNRRGSSRSPTRIGRPPARPSPPAPPPAPPHPRGVPRAAADRPQPLFCPLAAGAQQPGVEGDIAHLELDRLG